VTKIAKKSLRTIPGLQFGLSADTAVSDSNGGCLGKTACCRVQYNHGTDKHHRAIVQLGHSCILHISTISKYLLTSMEKTSCSIIQWLGITYRQYS